MNSIDRFNEKVKEDSLTRCWIWQGAKTPRNYGIFSHNGKTIGAHVFAWLVSRHLETIPEGLEVAHKCHNSLCVNPLHLELMTHKENCRTRKLRPFRQKDT